jgi:hypothetical protein
MWEIEYASHMLHTTEPTIYQLKVVLLGINPMICRRLLGVCVAAE